MKRFLKYSLLLFPLLFFWAGKNFHRAHYANDPEYIYLMNALAICKGKSVGTTDNPGTTVMQLGAATIALQHAFSQTPNDGLVYHVLKKPDQFVEAIQNGLLFMNSLVLLLLGIVALRKTGALLAALLMQLTVFISANALEHYWTKVSPEPVLFFITTIFVVAVLFFYKSGNKQNFRYPLVFALITGFGLGTKATFLPLAVFPFFIFPGFKKKLFYFSGAVISFVLFTIPAIPEYRSMFFWFRDLIIHSGRYGQGEKGVIDSGTYLPNLLRILENNPLFGVVVMAGIIVLIYVALIKPNRNKKATGNNRTEMRILTGLVATSALGILMTAKHYHANHYLIPVLLLTGVTLYFSIHTLLKAHRVLFRQDMVLTVLLVVLATWLRWRQPPVLKKADHYYRLSNEEMRATNQMIARDFPEHTIIHYYTFSLNKFIALRFGNIYAKNSMLEELETIYPETYFYDYSKDRFTNWEEQVTLGEIIRSRGKKILMISGPRSEPKMEEMAARGIPLKNIYKGRLQTIHELDSLAFNSQAIPGQAKTEHPE